MPEENIVRYTPKNMPEFPDGEDVVYSEETGLWYLAVEQDRGNNIFPFETEKELMEYKRSKESEQHQCNTSEH